MNCATGQIDGTDDFAGDNYSRVEGDDAAGTEEMKLYVNGVERGTKDYSDPIDSNENDLLIGDIVGFNGIIDEIRIWNIARDESEIRTDMSRKLTGSEPGLAAYWRLDETSGTLCTDLSASSNTATMTNMNPATDRISSDAPIGDASTCTYTEDWTGVNVSLSHVAGDDITVGSVTATPSGIHIYRVDGEPDVTTPPDGYEWLDPTRYWGTFIVDCTSATYTVTYDYDGHPGIVNENALKLAKRTDGADTTWEDTGAILDTGVNTLTSTGETGTEYILGTSSQDNPLPVELAFFIADVTKDGVILRWRTESEVENMGFNLYGSRSEEGPFSKVNSQPIPGAGSSPLPHEYAFTDDAVEGGCLYFYYLEDVNLHGAAHQSETIRVFVPSESHTAVPEDFALLQNFPNPFNPGTWIPYQLPAKASGEIRIYDVAGHLVRTLSAARQSSGYYTTEKSALYWDGRDEHGNTVSSGIYIYQMRAGNFTEKRKMVVMK